MSITVNHEKKQFHLRGKDFSYVFHVTENRYLNHLYYGKVLAEDADLTYRYQKIAVNDFCGQIDGTPVKYTALKPEYSQANYGDFRDPAIFLQDELGAPVVDFRYDSYEIYPEKPLISSGIPSARGGETLAVRLFDPVIHVELILLYTVYEDLNILTRRAEIRNIGEKKVRLQRAMSLSLDFPADNFRVLTLHGNHATECQREISPLVHGQIISGNSRGFSSHQSSPFVALMRAGADEEQGEIFGCNLMYSGSHYECVEQDPVGTVRLIAGIHPLNFSWLLTEGERFETPEAVLCFSDEGLGKMSRSYHDFFRRYVINPAFVEKPRPVVLNSWEGFRFRFDNKMLLDTVDALKGSGIDVFVLDDGWFGARNDDRAGLGDWYVNREKLPGGLKEISDRCREVGLGFGLWIEPEMVNPDSDLYRAHPDWVIRAPGREPVVSRNQCILDFSRRDVLEYIKKQMYEVIRDSGACYIKWDANRHMTENYSSALPAERQGELQHRYMLGVYELAEYLTTSFPDILFEGCSGGGGRFDGAMLHYFPQYWTSDNTDAHDRTMIQYGNSLCYPPCSQSCHVSKVPNQRNGRVTSLRTRTDIACRGILGYEFDVRNMTEEEKKSIPEDIKKYHSIEDLILKGDLYRMKNTFDSNEMCEVLVSKDKSRAYVTYYQCMNTHKTTPDIRINGLDEKRKYQIAELGLTLGGDVLKNAGISLPKCPGDFSTVTLTLTAVE